MKENSITSDGVLNALRDGPLREPAHAWLYEVRNGTGYSRQERYADALVVSCWPSRGIWIAGIEVKVSRTDWKRELDDPTKAAEIQRFCDYWYIAAPEGVVLPGEVPERWGHYELSTGKKPKPKLAKEAPRLTPEALSGSFVASVLRNAAKQQERAVRIGRDQMRKELMAEVDQDVVASMKAQLLDAQRAKDNAEQQVRYAKNETEMLRGVLLEFERETGASLGLSHSRMWGSGRNIGAQFKLAELLARFPPEVLAGQLKTIASELESVAIAAKPFAKADVV